jgi:hypothetical protein
MTEQHTDETTVITCGRCGRENRGTLRDDDERVFALELPGEPTRLWRPPLSYVWEESGWGWYSPATVSPLGQRRARRIGADEDIHPFEGGDGDYGLCPRCMTADESGDEGLGTATCSRCGRVNHGTLTQHGHGPFEWNEAGWIDLRPARVEMNDEPAVRIIGAKATVCPACQTGDERATVEAMEAER